MARGGTGRDCSRASLGRPPVTVPLPLGRFMVTMTDPDEGLRTSRMIDVTHDGTASFHIRLGMGSVLQVAHIRDGGGAEEGR